MGMVIRAAGKDPQTATVPRGCFHIKNRQSIRRENPVDGHQREIGIMFMIGSIKLGLCYHIGQMRKLECGHAFRFQHNGKALHEIIDIGNMCQNIVWPP